MAGRGGVVSWVKVSYSWHSGLVLGRNLAEPADLHLEAQIPNCHRHGRYVMWEQAAQEGAAPCAADGYPKLQMLSGPALCSWGLLVTLWISVAVTNQLPLCHKSAGFGGHYRDDQISSAVMSFRKYYISPLQRPCAPPWGAWRILSKFPSHPNPHAPMNFIRSSPIFLRGTPDYSRLIVIRTRHHREFYIADDCISKLVQMRIVIRFRG
jgi:hypothetical protein